MLDYPEFEEFMTTKMKIMISYWHQFAMPPHRELQDLFLKARCWVLNSDNEMIVIGQKSKVDL